MITQSLDLHGVRHHAVGLLVENFVYKHQSHLPVVIICGNSNRMIELVNETLDCIECQYEESRYGLIRVVSI